LSTRLFAGGKLLEEVAGKSRDHVKRIVEGIIILGEIIKNYSELDYEEVRRKYSELNKREEESDEIKRNLMSLLKASHLHPEDREDLLRIVLTLDDIIGLAKAVTKKLMVFKHLQLEIPRGVHVALLDMAVKSIEAVRLVGELVEHVENNYTRVLEVANRIEELEEEVDEIRLRAFEELLKECSSRFKEICIVMPVVIDDMEKVTDKCEDIADLFRLYVISR